MQLMLKFDRIQRKVKHVNKAKKNGLLKRLSVKVYSKNYRL